MPKLIDYPRTTYASAWEVAEVVDDTGGKCALETCARKLNRKVSGSFKAIIGSAVKFGLLTSKRELLSTTTLFRRIKHAYDKQEELLFHREAFLTPPLFTQLCRKFRQRELPVPMLDIMLIREFGVEEINATAVAKAFTEGARAIGLLDEHNVITDIDQLSAQSSPRRELASPTPATNSFRNAPIPDAITGEAEEPADAPQQSIARSSKPSNDAVASLFGLLDNNDEQPAPRPTKTSALAPVERTAELPLAIPIPKADPRSAELEQSAIPVSSTASASMASPSGPLATTPLLAILPTPTQFTVRLSGPGLDTQLVVADEDDLALVQGLLEKIRRQLRT